MARLLKLTIHETQEQLEKCLRGQTTASGKERLQMLYWLKVGACKSRQELVKRLQRNEATITRWLNKYKAGGLAGLLEVKHASGKESVVKGEALAALKQRLQQPQGFKSYKDIQEWLQGECGVKAADKTVHKLVRYRLKAKLKVPRPRSFKQHPQAQEVFKKTLEKH